MAISAKSVGTWATVSATSQTVTLPTHAAGDMLIVRVGCKPYTGTPSISTTGWAAVGDAYANGADASGNGTGSVVVRAFWKIAESAAETNPVVDYAASTSPSYAVAVVYQKGAGEAWVTPTGAGGGDNTARTSQTATIGSHISVTAGDMVDFFTVICDNITPTVPDITQAGVTYDTVTEYPATAGSTTASNDLAADGGYRLASSGTSSAAAVVTNTLSAAEQSGAWQTRLRVEATTQVNRDLQAVWKVAAPVNKTLQAQWKVAQAVGQNLQSIWAVATSVNRTLQAQWEVATAVGKSLQAIWDTLAPAYTNAYRDVSAYRSTNHTYRPGSTATPVTRSLELDWRVWQAVGKSLQSVWKVRHIVPWAAKSTYVPSVNCYDLIRSGDTWVYVRNSAGIAYTTSGNPFGGWTETSAISGANSLRGGAADGTHWVLGDNVGGLYHATSPSGTWTKHATNFGATDDVVPRFVNGQWFVVTETGKIFLADTPTDPTGGWTQATNSGFGGSRINDLAYDGTYYIAVGAVGKIAYTTTPGGTWTLATGTGSSAFNAVHVADGYVAAVADGATGISYCTAGSPNVSWLNVIPAPIATSGDLDGIKHWDGQWWVCGADSSFAGVFLRAPTLTPLTAWSVVVPVGAPWSIGTNLTDMVIGDRGPVMASSTGVYGYWPLERTATWNVRATAGKNLQSIWNVLAAAGLTAVGQTVQAIWHTRSLASQTVQSIWDVRATVARTVEARWNVRAAVARTVQSVWDVRRAVGQAVEARWNVRAAVNRTVQSIWNTRAAVARTVEARWHVRQAVARAAELRWKVATTVNRAVQSVWNVRAAVARTVETRWNVRQAIARTAELRWNVATTVNRTVQSVWNVRRTVGQAVELRWNVLSFLAAVGRNLQAVWHTRSAVGQAVQAQWRVLVTVGQTVQARWRVLATVGQAVQAQWRVLVTVAQSVQSVWNVRRAVGQIVEFRWNVLSYLAAVGRNVQVVWHTRGIAAQTLQSVWNVRSTVARTVQSVWNVRRAVGQAVEARWNVRRAIAQTVQSVWNVRSTVTQTVQARWRVLVTVGQSVQARWAVRSLAARTVAAMWNVRQTVDRTLQTRWNVLAVVGQQVRAIWNVVGPITSVARELALRWHTRGIAAQTLQSVWNVRSTVARTLQSRWAVLVMVGRAYGFQWKVRALAAQQLVAQWHTRGIVAQTVTSTWRVLQTTGTTLQSRWRVLVAVGQSVQARWKVAESVGQAVQAVWALRTPVSRTLTQRWRVLTLGAGIVVRRPGLRIVRGEFDARVKRTSTSMSEVHRHDART